MKTVKLPYTCNNDDKQFIGVLQKQSSSMIKLAYNRFWDNLTEKEIRNLSKSYNNIELLNSWLIQCAIKKANGLFKKDKQSNKKTIFGGKFNFIQRSEQKISKEEFRKNICLPICSQGEKLHKGNRMFNFKFNENKVIFKFNKDKHIEIVLPKLRTNLKKELNKVQQLLELKEITITVELTQDFIYFTYDETLLNEVNYKGNNNIVAAVDLNPEYIGFSISHFTSKGQRVLHKEVISLQHFTQNLHLSSSHKNSKKQVRKQNHETIEICKYLVNKCKRFHVGKFSIEDLSFKSKENKNKQFNRLCKNKWNRATVSQYIEKYCKLLGINFIKINSCYTSFIGNLIYNEPDMVAASLEIARRGYFKFQKGKFYPGLIKVETLGNRWKEALEWTYSSWVELFKKVKIMEMKYRNSLEDYSFKVLRFSSSKSCINLYSFI